MAAPLLPPPITTTAWLLTRLPPAPLTIARWGFYLSGPARTPALAHAHARSLPASALATKLNPEPRSQCCDDFPPIFDDDGKLKPSQDGSLLDDIHIVYVAITRVMHGLVIPQTLRM